MSIKDLPHITQVDVWGCFKRYSSLVLLLNFRAQTVEQVLLLFFEGPNHEKES
jgi:hypothetical protein